MAQDRSNERVEQLRGEIAFHDYRYYVLDDPVISDAGYDALMDELRELEEQATESEEAGAA